MTKDEAIRRLTILIDTHISLLEDLGQVREWFMNGDYDSSSGLRELRQEVTVHTRKLWKAVARDQKAFEIDLFGLNERNQGHEVQLEHSAAGTISRRRDAVEEQEQAQA